MLIAATCCCCCCCCDGGDLLGAAAAGAAMGVDVPFFFLFLVLLVAAACCCCCFCCCCCWSCALAAANKFNILSCSSLLNCRSFPTAMRCGDTVAWLPALPPAAAAITRRPSSASQIPSQAHSSNSMWRCTAWYSINPDRGFSSLTLVAIVLRFSVNVNWGAAAAAAVDCCCCCCCKRR